MPDENEQNALSKIKAYLDAGHSVDAIREEYQEHGAVAHSILCSGIACEEETLYLRLGERGLGFRRTC